ncbi:hypothetical protein BJP05_00500 [Corynebacterium sp. NML98-0116]|uniref:hypothetical protein n=1 Tax=Corynebacterium sp. NML98-0116 TaxID=702967 RepID=UPI0008789BE3|nr:hypothetical protein [Corynebacterium sp. NML98-0116]AOX04828.1 hypothetical protein BJP05_00500 [Corynebacterium sp. NML98-0116]
MKKFATAAVAATMALGLAVPTAGAAEDKGSDGAYWITTVVTGNTCKIANSAGTNETITREAARLDLRKYAEGTITSKHSAFLRGAADSKVTDFYWGEATTPTRHARTARTTPPTS